MAEGQKVVFEGLVKWAVIPPRQARGPHKDYTEENNKDDLHYSIEVECSQDKFDKLRKAGIPRLTELRKDEETGKTYIRIKGTKRKTNLKGDPWEFKDIETSNADGTPLEESVGNGSEAVVEASLEDMKKGKVLRLKSVKITKLIPYEKSETTSKESPKSQSATSADDIF